MLGEIISGGLAVAGGLLGAKGAKDAANIQAGAANQATAETRRQFDIARDDMEPYRDAGGSAVNTLAFKLGLGSKRDPNDQRYKEIYSRLYNQINQDHVAKYGISLEDSRDAALPGVMRDIDLAAEKEFSQRFGQSAGYGELNRKFTMEDFEADPVRQASFQFGMDEGSKALRRMLGAKGMARSGAAVKELTRYGSDYTNQRAGESSGRFYADQDRVFNRLAGVSGTGQTATTNTAQLGAQSAATTGGLTVGAANARGAASIAGANSYGNALSTVGGQYQTRMLMDSIANRNPTPSYGTRPAFLMDNGVDQAYESYA